MTKNEICVIYGEEPALMTKKLLEEAGLAGLIRQKEKEKRKTDIHIGIKPNLVGAIPASQGATTHSEIVEELVKYLQKHSFEHITILEGSWIGDSTKKAFKMLGYEKISQKYHIPLIDTKHDNFVKKEYNNIDMEISQTALSLDYLINVPVLKGHCQTKITGAMKNLKGIISDKEKRHFHSLGLHEPIAYLNKLICADFILLDGICGDLDFEEGGNPIAMNRIACGLDSVLIDSYIATTMGYRPDDIRYITIADKIGVGSKEIAHANIRELNKDTTKTKPASSRRVQKLSAYAEERDACSACYANLIQALARMEDAGVLSNFQKKTFVIGQGFRNTNEKNLQSKKQDKSDTSHLHTAAPDTCIGIGTCTKKFKNHIDGCPVKATDILQKIK